MWGLMQETISKAWGSQNSESSNFVLGTEALAVNETMPGMW